MDRYQLFVSNQPGDAVAIRVYDSMLKRIIVKWQGEVARQLLESEVLPCDGKAFGCRRCDKALIRKLTLTAAAIVAAIDTEQSADRLRRRMHDLDIGLTPFHSHIARLLFAYPERHFAHEEVICLLTLQNPSVNQKRIANHLDDLVRWHVIQRIDVGRAHVFYDTNTRPHLHVYCPQAHELHDAPDEGVLRVAGRRLSAIQSADVAAR